MRRRRTIRRSQTLSPFGVGSMYDVLGESFVAADTTSTSWTRAETISMPRLAANLPGIRDFRTPRPAPEETWKTGGPGVPFQRFPRWLFCPTCRVMTRWNRSREQVLDGGQPVCDECDRHSDLVPMRFVSICRRGHLDDVDWGRWAHSGGGGAGGCRGGRLLFRSRRGAGSGLASLEVWCAACKSSRDLFGITSKDMLGRLGAECRGLQPWLAMERAEDCDETPQVVQRGASNVHFSEIRSAIDIPPWSDFDETTEEVMEITTNTMFPALVNAMESGNNQALIDTLSDAISAAHDVTVDQVVRLVRAELGETEVDAFEGISDDELIEQEYDAFLAPREGTPDPRNGFIARHVGLGPSAAAGRLKGLVADVVVAERLREVRTLVGFTRLTPEGDTVAPDLGRGLQWLPAIETFGEGVFVQLDETELQQWEQRPDVRDRVRTLEANRLESPLAKSRLREVATPRRVMIHTLAHVMIRQLTFECGYSSASLRERLYARSGGRVSMAGLLVYTASGDSEGTLGGLARQGEPPRLASTIVQALVRSTWCSTDPICIESEGQGMSGLNRGACHGCALVAETSCTEMNSLLDRALLVGTPYEPDLGFFSDIVELVMTEA